MTNMLAPAQTRRSLRSVRPSFAVAAALVLILTIATAVWQVPGRKGLHTTNAHAGVGAVSGATTPLLLSEDALPSFLANKEDDWERFRSAIQQPTPQQEASDVPAYAIVLGLTSEEKANGTPAVKRLVLDLGDLSVYAIAPASP